MSHPLDRLVDIPAAHRNSAVYKGPVTLRAWQEELYRLLEQFDALCRQHRAEYWLDFGTLLGAHRHRRIIPWDNDVDVTMLQEDLEKLPPHVDLADAYFRRYDVYDHRNPRHTVAARVYSKRDGSFMDVFVVRPSPTREGFFEYHECPMYRASGNGLWGVAPASRLFPLRQIELRGRWYPCPNQTRRHLDLCYGNTMTLPAGKESWLSEEERYELSLRR